MKVKFRSQLNPPRSEIAHSDKHSCRYNTRISKLFRRSVIYNAQVNPSIKDDEEELTSSSILNPWHFKFHKTAKGNTDPGAEGLFSTDTLGSNNRPLFVCSVTRTVVANGWANPKTFFIKTVINDRTDNCMFCLTLNSAIENTDLWQTLARICAIYWSLQWKVIVNVFVGWVEKRATAVIDHKLVFFQSDDPDLGRVLADTL